MTSAICLTLLTFVPESHQLQNVEFVSLPFGANRWQNSSQIQVSGNMPGEGAIVFDGNSITYNPLGGAGITTLMMPPTTPVRFTRAGSQDEFEIYAVEYRNASDRSKPRLSVAVNRDRTDYARLLVHGAGGRVERVIPLENRRGNRANIDWFQAQTAFVDTPINGARRWSLTAEVGGSGTLIADPNRAMLDAAGSPSGTTRMATQEHKVRLRQVRDFQMGEPGFRLFDLDGAPGKMRVAIGPNQYGPIRLVFLDNRDQVTNAMLMEPVSVSWGAPVAGGTTRPAEPPQRPVAATADLVGVMWQLVEVLDGSGRASVPSRGKHYVLHLTHNGQFTLRSDAVTSYGGYRRAGATLSMTPGRGAAASFEADTFGRNLVNRIGDVASYSISRNRLTLSLRGGAGRLIFETAR
ncbi:MAG: hypothetical protein ACK4XJ_07555 [Fimbriimonadaceae bacterium]